MCPGIAMYPLSLRMTWSVHTTSSLQKKASKCSKVGIFSSYLRDLFIAADCLMSESS